MRRTLTGLAAACALLAARAASACPEPAVTGVQPCDDVLKQAMIGAGAGTLGSAGWGIHTMHAFLGTSAKVVPGWVPCVILSSVATTESTWHQFGYVACGKSAPTLVSADCGYGIGQITSGMDGSGGFSAQKVAADATYNLSVSVNILISKWEYTAAVTPNDPKIAEDWYFALWGYNGLAASNNPNTHTDTLGTYYDPTNPAYPRSHYAYQEIVLGYALHPTTGTDGTPRWPSTKITHINFSEICASCGNPGGTTVVSRPSPEHSGDCVSQVPDWAAQYVSQSFPLASQGAVTLHAGESTPAFIELKNVGAKSWDDKTRLGTTQPRDRASPFAASDWVSPSRPAQVAGSVASGDSFKFQFTFQAPDKPGDYTEFFGVVEEGVAWFSDPGQGGPPDDQLQAKLTVLPALPVDAGNTPGRDATSSTDAGLVADSGPHPLADGSVLVGDVGTGPDSGEIQPAGPGCSCQANGLTYEFNAGLLAALAALLNWSRRKRLQAPSSPF